VTQPAITAPVRVGGYALEVGTSAESFARFEPEPDAENAQALGAALAHEPDEHALVEAVEGLQEDAAAVTNRVERANSLFRAAAEGHLLDPASLTGEIDALLGLLGRLDRAGRFDEELRLARALSGLLAISLRWLELVRVLRAMLRSAQAAGSLPGQAWALHELGSLHLCAGDPETAAKRLDEALRLEQSLGNPFARCATRHNLDSARRDLALRAAAGGWPRRLLRLVGLVAVLALLGGAGTAIALAVGGDGGGGAVTTNGHTSTSTTTSATDTSPPVVSLAAPVDGTTVTTPTPEFSGAAGTEPGDDPVVSVLVADDTGSPIEGFPRSAPVDGGSWMLTPAAGIADGSYTVSASQHDDAGHTGTSATNAFTIDTAAPALELDCPATIASPEKCTLTSSDAGSARVDVYEVGSTDGTESESLLPDSPHFELEAGVATSVTFGLPSLDPNGVAFRVVAVQRDAAGNDGRSNSERIEPDVVQ
jgi:Bacterial Ig-like domain